MANRKPLVLVTNDGSIQQVQSGDLLDPAVLGTGTASSSVFLRGDGQWATPIMVRRRQAPVYAATITIDCSTGDVFDLTLTGNPTINFSNASEGQTITLRLKQDATGSRAPTWGTMVKFGTGITASVATLSTAANALDLIGFQYNAQTALYQVVSFAPGF